MSLLFTGLIPTVALAQDTAERLEELPRDRRAVEIALDASYGASGTDQLSLGGGAALRAGYALPVSSITFVPEVGVDAFGFGATRGTPNAAMYGGFVGGRLRFGRVFEPGVFAHVGVLGVSWRDDYVAPTADAGLFLELALVPWLILGVQGEFKSTFATDGRPTISWYTFGLTGGVRL
jgi:hypothetical protein